ncbi:MAG: helix-turn-helix transcriptional regulator [Clostridia bacterium]|nr:helix-turn-helix transcriptional regulator [Clostridia bacterium]
MIIGKRIKELRQEYGLSLQKLADAIGVDKHAIIYWEQETNEPKASYIVRLANFFNVTTDYLLGLTDE